MKVFISTQAIAAIALLSSAAAGSPPAAYTAQQCDPAAPDTDIDKSLFSAANNVLNATDDAKLCKKISPECVNKFAALTTTLDAVYKKCAADVSKHLFEPETNNKCGDLTGTMDKALFEAAVGKAPCLLEIKPALFASNKAHFKSMKMPALAKKSQLEGFTGSDVQKSTFEGITGIPTKATYKFKDDKKKDEEWTAFVNDHWCQYYKDESKLPDAESKTAVKTTCASILNGSSTVAALTAVTMGVLFVANFLVL